MKSNCGKPVKTALERRLRKNNSSRARADALKKRVAAIALKLICDRTVEEQRELDDFEERRLRKNDRCRQRTDLLNTEMDRILQLPSKLRSADEQEFLSVQLRRKVRKNEGDRIRRLRSRGKLCDDMEKNLVMAQHPLPVTRSATSTAYLQQKKLEMYRKSADVLESHTASSSIDVGEQGDQGRFDDYELQDGADDPSPAPLDCEDDYNTVGPATIDEQCEDLMSHTLDQKLPSTSFRVAGTLEEQQETGPLHVTAQELIAEFERKGDDVFGTADNNSKLDSVSPLYSMPPMGRHGAGTNEFSGHSPGPGQHVDMSNHFSLPSQSPYPFILSSHQRSESAASATGVRALGSFYPPAFQPGPQQPAPGVSPSFVSGLQPAIGYLRPTPEVLWSPQHLMQPVWQEQGNLAIVPPPHLAHHYRPNVAAHSMVAGRMQSLSVRMAPPPKEALALQQLQEQISASTLQSSATAGFEYSIEDCFNVTARDARNDSDIHTS